MTFWLTKNEQKYFELPRDLFFVHCYFQLFLVLGLVCCGLNINLQACRRQRD